MGFRSTTIMVNAQRIDDGFPVEGRSDFISATTRMIPLPTKVQKRNQGNNNHVAWSLASKNKCMPYMIVLGLIDTK